MEPQLLTILFCGLSLAAAQPSWARKWSDATGKFSIEAEFVEVKADKVVLRKAGGAVIPVPIARLSPVDRRYLERAGVPLTEAIRQAIKAAAQGRRVQVSPDVLRSYEGVYAITPQFALTVTLDGDTLMVQATRQQKLEVLPESETRFICNPVDAQLTFVPGKNGKAELLILHQNGANQVATRQVQQIANPGSKVLDVDSALWALGKPHRHRFAAFAADVMPDDRRA